MELRCHCLQAAMNVIVQPELGDAVWKRAKDFVDEQRDASVPQSVLTQHLLYEQAKIAAGEKDYARATGLQMELLQQKPQVDVELMEKTLKKLDRSSSKSPNVDRAFLKESNARLGKFKKAEAARLREKKNRVPKIPFTVIELTGKAIPITSFGGLHTVAEIKQEVAAQTGGDAERLRLVLNGAPLDDAGLTLTSCGIEAGSELVAVAKLDGAEVGVPAERAADLEAVAPSAAGRPGTPPKELRRGSRTPPRIPAAKVRAAVVVKRPRVRARVVSGPS